MSSDDAFRVALPNGDVHRGKVIEQALDGRYPNPKIDTAANPPHAGIIFLNWATTGIAPADNTVRTLFSFPHGYNKTPTVFASYKYDDGSTVLKGTLPFQYGALGLVVIDADPKNINLKFFSTDFLGNPVLPFTLQVRFYVMAEHGVDP